MRKKWKSNFLDRYLNWVNQGFIMLRKGTDDSPGEFWDLGIELHALNEERFQLAFPRVSSKEDTVDLARVNSIMRPTLPRGRVFYIRSPW